MYLTRFTKITMMVPNIDYFLILASDHAYNIMLQMGNTVWNVHASRIMNMPASKKSYTAKAKYFMLNL
jgi:hypothetical protein